MVVVGLAAFACLMSALPSIAAPRNSIKVVLPKQFLLGHGGVIELTGYASGTTPTLWLYSQPQRCPSTLTAETNISDVTIWIGLGHRVKDGRYKYRYPVDAQGSTHGAMNFCAYLTNPGPNFSYITSAHASLRFRIPS